MNKKLLFLLFACFVTTFCFADGIKFNEDKAWKEILSLAKKEKKLIFLDAYASWCGPCIRMQRDIFTNSQVGNFYNDAFINVKMDMEKEGDGTMLSEKYSVTAYPTLLFINSDGEVIHKSVGGMAAESFISLGKDALDPSKQFYTLKKEAIAGTLSPTVFDNWIHEAEQMNESDLDDVITSYLSKTKAPLIEKEMLAVILDHATSISEKQLKELFTNQKKILELNGITKPIFDQSFIPLLTSMADEKILKQGNADFADYQKLIAGYYPSAAALETVKAKVRYYSQQKNNAECLKAMTQLLTNKTLGLKAYDLATHILKYGEEIVAESQGNTFLRYINNFQLLPAEKDLIYYKDASQMFLYYYMGDKSNKMTYAQKIINNKNAPDFVKELAEKMIE